MRQRFSAEPSFEKWRARRDSNFRPSGSKLNLICYLVDSSWLCILHSPVFLAVWGLLDPKWTQLVGVTPQSVTKTLGTVSDFLAWRAVTRVTGSSILLTDYRVRAVRRRNGEKAQILPVPIVTSFDGIILATEPHHCSLTS